MKCEIEDCEVETKLPFNCKFCGKQFCVKHRLPENHHCVGLLNGNSNQPERKKKKTTYQKRSKYSGKKKKFTIVLTIFLLVVVIIAGLNWKLIVGPEFGTVTQESIHPNPYLADVYSTQLFEKGERWHISYTADAPVSLYLMDSTNYENMILCAITPNCPSYSFLRSKENSDSGSIQVTQFKSNCNEYSCNTFYLVIVGSFHFVDQQMVLANVNLTFTEYRWDLTSWNITS